MVMHLQSSQMVRVLYGCCTEPTEVSGTVLQGCCTGLEVGAWFEFPGYLAGIRRRVLPV